MRCRERVTPSDSGILPFAGRIYSANTNHSREISTRGAESREPTHRFGLPSIRGPGREQEEQTERGSGEG